MGGEEVPANFAHWLLAMGCPAEKVPSVDNISEICRGQYYMVWRSLMEQVYARDEIRAKRMQVFCDDIRKIRKNYGFHGKDSSTVVPEQITLLQQQNELKQKVAQARERVALAQQDLGSLMDKISGKMAQRNLISQKVEDASRRVWLLRQVAADLQDKKTNLQDARAIANSLACSDEDRDIQSKLDKCLIAFRRQYSGQDYNMTTSSSSSVSGDSDVEALAWSVTSCGGEWLCAQLQEKRAQLVDKLASDGAKGGFSTLDKVTPRQVLTHTAGLHCTLALETKKNEILLKEAKLTMCNTVAELNNCLTSEECELLVLQCDKASLEARVTALRSLMHELTDGTGAFHVGGPVASEARQRNDIVAVDKAIESKKEEVQRVISMLTATAHRIHATKECLTAVFAAFRNLNPPPLHYKGIQLELPQVSLASLREYYETQRERRKKKVDLSLDFEASDGSLADVIDYNNPCFVDELQIYLKKFNLDNNRQLVLNNGEKIWQFETLASSIKRLQEQCLENELSCSLLCPSRGLAQCLGHLATLVATKADLEANLKALMIDWEVKQIDISSEKEEEERTIDITKKRLRDSLQELQKVNKVLVTAENNIELWSSNKARKYILDARKVDGMTYEMYENEYLENCIHI